jgi:hypothetical protein
MPVKKSTTTTSVYNRRTEVMPQAMAQAWADREVAKLKLSKSIGGGFRSSFKVTTKKK